MPPREAGQLRLPSLISNHMVLQAGRPAKLWGRDTPGQKVTAEIDGQSAEATADEDGRWDLTLPELEAGGPHLLAIRGSGKIVVQDVLVGEVWLASGQSNMAWPLAQSSDAEADLPQANRPGIRFFTVAKQPAEHPQTAMPGQWLVCTPEGAAAFSAVAYYFGLELERELDTPVGLIGSYWGGTAIQPWTPESGLEATEPGRAALAKRDRWWPEEAREAGDREIRAWVAANSVPDPGNEGEALGWAQPSLNDTEWKTQTMPGAWERDGHKVNGVAWLRREVAIPEAWAGRELELRIGTWGDTVTAYYNGTRLEPTGRDERGVREYRLSFAVPAAEVGSGPALIALRLYDAVFEGGLRGNLQLGPVDEESSLDLKGPWKRKMGATHPPLSREVRQTKPFVPPKHWLGAALYNGMIAPVVPYTIAGVIWYQGESNARAAQAYEALFPALIESWRREWGQGDFPFYFVQLANFRERREEPGEAQWAELREAQRQALAVTANTGMAVAIDLGDANDIHPGNKKDVGKRLALLARASTYGDAAVRDSGPSVAGAMAAADAEVVVSFDHAVGLRTTDGRPPVGFALAGEDRVFHWAEARIDGESVRLVCPMVSEPAWVRYAWADNPEVNLVNEAGLPAVPFELPVAAASP